jgi:hypothetical protein
MYCIEGRQYTLASIRRYLYRNAHLGKSILVQCTLHLVSIGIDSHPTVQKHHKFLSHLSTHSCNFSHSRIKMDCKRHLLLYICSHKYARQKALAHHKWCHDHILASTYTAHYPTDSEDK